MNVPPVADPAVRPGAPTTSPSPVRTRAPLGARVAVVLLALLVLAHVVGGVLFGLVWADDPLDPGLVFLAMVVAGGATALAAIPGLLRGDRTAWLLATGWTVAFDYWTVYKVFTYPEMSSLPHLVVGLLLLGLLVSPSVRDAAGVR
jgi:hypothetical protein